MADDIHMARTSAPPMTGPTGRPMDANSLTGLNEDEAKSFGNMFVVSFLGFLAIAIVAHYLLWQGRPGSPGARGYPSAVTSTLDALTVFLA